MTTGINPADYSKLLNESKYESKCRNCGITIYVGESCYWRTPGGHGVICVTCKTGQKAVAKKAPKGKQAEWSRLVGFLRDTVLVGANSNIFNL